MILFAALFLAMQAACGTLAGPPPEYSSEASPLKTSLAAAPTSAVTESVKTPDAAEATQQPAPAVPEQRRVVLEWPPTIRMGDADVIRLTLELDDQGNLTPTAQIAGNQTSSQPVSIPNVYDTHNVLVEARLDLAGVEVVPQGDVIETMRPGQTVSFSWSVRPTQVGDYTGTIWVHLHFVPLDPAKGEESRIPLTAQIVRVHAVNFLGMGGLPARVMGGVGVVVGSVLGLDNLLSWAWTLLRRKKKP